MEKVKLDKYQVITTEKKVKVMSIGALKKMKINDIYKVVEEYDEVYITANWGIPIKLTLAEMN